MEVKLIRGGIGSGKSEICFNEMEDIHQKYPNHKLIMIVPDHYSYETELKAVRKFGGTGLNNIEVLTIRQMSINYLKRADDKYLTGAGRQMLIYKAVDRFCREYGDNPLIPTIRKNGFLDVISSLIQEMKRYSVLSKDISDKLPQLEENEKLCQKLFAVSKIYDYYSEFFKSGEYKDAEDDIDRVAEFIMDSDMYNNNVHVWFDRFDEYTPQQLKLIKSMILKGADVHISICYPLISNEYEEELFYHTKNTYERLEQFFCENGIVSRDTALMGNELYHIKSEELYKYFKNYDSSYVYDKPTDDISIFTSRDSYSEVERTASRIMDMTSSEMGSLRCRFRDIAVICGSIEEYQHIIDAVFTEYGIPYFSDETIILSDHPIAMQIMSVFDIIEDNWSYESVFRYLRAGYIYIKEGKNIYPISQNDVDKAENYVLKYGVRGEKRWTGDKAWNYEQSAFEQSWEEKKQGREFDADELRHKITAPIKSFKEKTKGAHTGCEMAQALFELIEDIHLYEGLYNEISDFKAKGMVNEAEQFEKIWNLIIEVLNQSAVTLRNEKVTLNEFGECIQAGLSKCEIRTIPSGIDQVYVGSVERSTSKNVRVMFVIGAKSGTFPGDIKSEGFLSNNDRISLAEADIRLAPDTEKQMQSARFKVYRALSAATEKLCFSYPIQNSEGNAQRPARIISDAERMFTKIEKDDDIINSGEYISAPDAAWHKLIIHKSKKNKQNEPLWDSVYKWFASQEKWRDRLAVIDAADNFDKRKNMLSPKAAAELYRDIHTYSAGKLNEFAQCPFKYFLTYGLRAKEREIWEISPADVGTFAHRVIEELCSIVEDGAETREEKIERWKALEDTAPIISEIIERRKQAVSELDLRDKEKLLNIFARIEKTVKNSARIIHLSLKNGRYYIKGKEKRFDINIGRGIHINGIIDRMDTCDTERGINVRIIDYKTGKTGFDINDILNRINMQTVIYAIAAKDIAQSENPDKNVRLTGLYYNKVRDDFVTGNIGNKSKAMSERRRLCRLDGMTFVDTEDMDKAKEMLKYMDEDIVNTGKSDILPVSFTQKGKFTSRSAVADIKDGEALMKYVKKAICDIDSDIYSGVIDAMPYQNGSMDACAYCEYEQVCSFDNKKCEPEIKKGKDAWEIIRKEADEDGMD